MKLLTQKTKANKATWVKEYLELANAYTAVEKVITKQDKLITRLKEGAKKQTLEQNHLVKVIATRDEEIADLAEHAIIAADTINEAEKEIAELRAKLKTAESRKCAKCPCCDGCKGCEKCKPTLGMRIRAFISKVKSKIFG